MGRLEPGLLQVLDFQNNSTDGRKGDIVKTFWSR